MRRGLRPTILTDMSRRARRPTPNDEPPAPPPVKPWSEESGETFGAWLRQQREIRKVGLREISERTKVGLRYLEALEENRFGALPAPIFARGFLREYAKYVGLDPDEVVNFYLSAARRQGNEEPDPVEAAPPVSSEAWRTVAILAVLVAAVLLLVLGLAYLDDRRESDRSQQRPPIAPPVVELPPEIPEPEREPVAETVALTVTLSFTDQCWVEAEVDGEHRVAELRVQGESMLLEADEQVVLTLGNPTAVRVEVNGEPLLVETARGAVGHLTIDRESQGIEPRPEGSEAAEGADGAEVES